MYQDYSVCQEADDGYLEVLFSDVELPAFIRDVEFWADDDRGVRFVDLRGDKRPF